MLRSGTRLLLSCIINISLNRCNSNLLTTLLVLVLTAYEYVPDSEIASVTVPTSLLTAQSGSEEDLLMDKVRRANNLVPHFNVNNKTPDWSSN